LSLIYHSLIVLVFDIMLSYVLVNHQHINKVILLGKIVRACVCVCWCSG